MLCQLYFSVRAFPEIGISGLNEFKIIFRNILEYTLKFPLLRRQRRLIIAILNKGSARFNPLALRQKHRVARLRILPGTLVLMELEPVLLKAPL